MQFAHQMKSVLATASLAMLAGTAGAKQTIKVGVSASFSGPFTIVVQECQAGIKTWMKQHGDTVAGKKIEIFYKDTTGAAPESAKRAAQDLITRDKVDFLARFGLTRE